MQIRTTGNSKYLFRILIPVFIVLLLMGSCSTIEGVLNLTRPTAEFEKVEITGLSFDRADLLFYDCGESGLTRSMISTGDTEVLLYLVSDL